MGQYRAQVWAKTGGICWYCGKQMNPFLDFEEEHQNPRIQGGGDELDNLQPACVRCNRRKKGRTVEEYREFLAGNGELRFWGEIPHETPQETLEKYKEAYGFMKRKDDALLLCMEYASWANPAIGPFLSTFVQHAEYMLPNDKHSEFHGAFTFDDLVALTRLTKPTILAYLYFLQKDAILDIYIKPTEHAFTVLTYDLYTEHLAYGISMLEDPYITTPKPEIEQRKQRFLLTA